MLLVTGATGFVGGAFCRLMSSQGQRVRGVVHRRAASSGDIQTCQISNLNGQTDWAAALYGVSGVVHLAARVHVMQDRSADPLAEFRRVNVDGTLNLAWQAAAAGVRRFIFVSSVKVNGESTQADRPFTADDQPSPADPYGLSKFEAEVGLSAVASQTGMELVIVRPPLVYGPGVKANFAAMMRWVARGVPLPLASVTQNRRSLVAVENLADLLVRCLEHPAAAGQTFMVSDGEDLSTAELLMRLNRAMGRSPRLFPFPPSILYLGAEVLGRGGVAGRLLDNLQVDISKTQTLLDWRPPLGVDEALARTVRAVAA